MQEASFPRAGHPSWSPEDLAAPEEMNNCAAGSAIAIVFVLNIELRPNSIAMLATVAARARCA